MMDINFKTRRASTIIEHGENTIEKKRAKNIVREQKANLETENIAIDKKIKENKLIANMRRSWIVFLIISLICSVISVMESVAGVCIELLNNKLAILIFGLVMLILQIAIIIYNYSSATIERYHFSDWTVLDKFALVVMGVSITCNYQFMKSILRNNSLFYTLITVVLASGLDILSRYCSRLAYNAHYRNYSYRGYTKRNNLLHKLYMIIFGKLLNGIDRKYNEVMKEIKEEKTGIENSPNVVAEYSKMDEKNNSQKSFHTSENKGIGTNQKTVQKQEDGTDKNVPKVAEKTRKSSVSRMGTGASSITFQDMQNNINNLEEGEIVKPSKVGMTGNGNYKNWIVKCENVEKVDNGWIKKTKQNNVIKLTKIN